MLRLHLKKLLHNLNFLNNFPSFSLYYYNFFNLKQVILIEKTKLNIRTKTIKSLKYKKENNKNKTINNCHLNYYYFY
jgi:hypothetical protein